MIMSNFYPTVKYMIVYDNLIENENLTNKKGENVSDDSYISVMPMNAADPTGIELGLFSINNESGNGAYRLTVLYRNSKELIHV